MEKLFRGDDHKLRPWSQITLVWLATILGQLGIGIVVYIVIAIYLVMTNQQDLVSGLENVMWFNNVMSGICNVISIVLTIRLYKRFNQQPITKMGLTSIEKDMKYFVSGLMLGIGSITVIMLTLVVMGNYKFVGFNLSLGLLGGLLLFIAVGFCEEILVRGFFQHVIAEKHKIVGAILIPSILFSVMHFANPNVGGIAALNLFLAGGLFGVITYKTGNLWLAIGEHITWNFAQGNLFGNEVSGMKFGAGLIQMERTVDNTLNGGNFGLEGGFVCTAVLVLLILYFLLIYKKSEKKEMLQN